MNRDELILVIAGALFGAVLLGWVLRALYSALNAPSGAHGPHQTATLIGRLEQAEAARMEAEAGLVEAENAMIARLRQIQAELDDADQRAAQAEQQMTEMREAWVAAFPDDRRDN